MTETTQKTTTLTADDGHEIAVDLYTPGFEANAVIQELHGLGEHAGRYRRFAEFMKAQGLIKQTVPVSDYAVVLE